jgi:hypothetical protein
MADDMFSAPCTLVQCRYTRVDRVINHSGKLTGYSLLFSIYCLSDMCFTLFHSPVHQKLFSTFDLSRLPGTLFTGGSDSLLNSATMRQNIELLSIEGAQWLVLAARVCIATRAPDGV